MTFHVFGALAEFERELIRERTLAGLEAARARGRPAAVRPEKLAAARAMREQKNTMPEIIKALGVSRATPTVTSRSATTSSM